MLGAGCVRMIVGGEWNHDGRGRDSVASGMAGVEDDERGASWVLNAAFRIILSIGAVRIFSQESN